MVNPSVFLRTSCVLLVRQGVTLDRVTAFSLECGSDHPLVFCKYTQGDEEFHCVIKSVEVEDSGIVRFILSEAIDHSLKLPPES